MTAHPDFAAAFAAGLRSGDLPPGATGGDPAEATRRFAVYRNNVAVSLGDALAARFPVIRRLVGEAFFAELAAAYRRDAPPATPVLAEWGAGFAAWLSAVPPLAAYPYMADVARIEYARGRAFHAADAVPVDPAHLAAADPATLCLGLHPSVTVLRLAHPAVTIWAMNQPGASPGPVPPGPETALILRDRAFDVPVIAIGPGDATLIGALGKGAPLMAAAAAAQVAEPGHAPQPILTRLMQAGALLQPELS